MSFKSSLELALTRKDQLKSNYLKHFLQSFFDPNAQFYKYTMKKTKDLTDSSELSDKQKDILSQIFKYTRVEYSL